MDSNILNDSAAQADCVRLASLPKDQCCRLVLNWLTAKQARRQALAEAILTSMESSGSQLLLSEAFGRGKRVHRRIQMLQALERVGEPLNADQLLLLLSAMPLFGPEVRNQITRIMSWNRAASAASRA